jgi:RNA polymerase sigma factor (sigma-70 family)
MRNFELVQELKLELIREYEQYVRILAGLTGASLEDAREALHRAICRMLVGLKKRPAGDPAIAWRPYVIRAAVNHLRDEINERKDVLLFSELDKEGRRKLLGVPDPHPTPLERLEKNETAEILWKEVATLSPREAEVLKRWAHGANFQDIAAALAIQPSTVRELWSRGIGHLRKRPGVQQLAA